MKVLLVGKHPLAGGAAIATSRLLEALTREGVEARMLVQEGADAGRRIHSTTRGPVKRWLNLFRFIVERLFFLPREKSRNIRFLFSPANTGENISRHALVREADIIHLHWINAGFLSLASLRRIFETGKPVVWTFHDMWPLTGGCHYALDCTAYQQECGQCPYLKRPHAGDLSHRIWKKKRALFQGARLSMVTPSHWLNRCVKSSSLLKHLEVSTIHNPVDPEVFHPADREAACRNLGLDPQKQYILFGAATMKNVMKGYPYFVEAIRHLSDMVKRDRADRDGADHGQADLGQADHGQADHGQADHDRVEILLFGKTREDSVEAFPFPTRNIAFVDSTRTLVELYSVAHVFVIPSLQDNLPNTILESMLCGCPVVGFRTGGIPEMIRHKENGYLADLRSSKDLAEGMLWVLSSPSHDSLSAGARESVLRDYSMKASVEAYLELYNNLLDPSSAS
jgi:glycosyltransferase involved in cell wall biosynthesis